MQLASLTAVNLMFWYLNFYENVNMSKLGTPDFWYAHQGSNWGDNLGLCYLRIGILEKCVTLDISKNILCKMIISSFSSFHA